MTTLDTAAEVTTLVTRLVALLAAPAQPAPPAAPTQRSRVLLTVEEAAQQLGVGRTTMFALVKSGAVESVQIGRLRRVPVAAVQAYAARLVAEASA